MSCPILPRLRQGGSRITRSLTRKRRGVDVEVEMVGMIWLTGPQYGREPHPRDIAILQSDRRCRNARIRPECQIRHTRPVRPE